MTPMPELWPHLLDVADRARRQVSAGKKRVLIQSPTGSGKGSLIAYLSRLSYDRGKRVLVLNNRRDIVNELSRRLELFSVPHGVIMNGIGTQQGRVQIASRDTLNSRSIRNDWSDLPPADFLILDEAHRWKGDVYSEIFSRYPGAVVVGLTATPANPDGSGFGTSFWQALECAVPVSELIRTGKLVNVVCYAPQSMVQGKVTKKGLRGDPVARWKQHADGRPTVAFTTRVSQSLALVERFRQAGVPADHIDAHTPDDVREDVKERLRTGKILVASQVGIWLEGVDIPELSCCIMLRACGSRVLYLQAVGRILRSHPSKTKGAILIDHAGACTRHGLPADDVEWSLDESDTIDARLKRARKEGKEKVPIPCPRCGMYFTGSLSCPACGHTLKVKQKMIEVMNEILVRVPPGRKAMVEAEERLRCWKRCVGICAAKGRVLGAAAAMFAREMGAPPWRLGIPNLPTGDDWKRPILEVYPNYGRGFLT